MMVKFVRQSGNHGDCGVVTLAMLAGVSYEDALAAVVIEQPAALQTGLSWAELRRAATTLGLKTRLRRKYDLDRDSGILNVAPWRKRDVHKDEHFVFLWRGRIVEGNGELWPIPEAYLKQYHYKARMLLVTDEEE